jgi:hypothetical protein
MDLSDPCDRYGSLDAAFARVNSKVLVVSYENDILFPWWQSKEIVASLLRNKKSVSYCHLESGTGHDSFLTDIEHLSKVVGGFLSERPVKVMKWQVRLHRNVLVSSLRKREGGVIPDAPRHFIGLYTFDGCGGRKHRSVVEPVE